MNINQEYARKFEERKRKEDLARAADRGLLDEDSEQTEEDEAEDVNPEVDLQILDIIQRIRKKDPSIYDPNAKFFDSKEEIQLEQDQRIKSNKQEQKKDKMTIGQYFRSSEYLGKKKEELDQEEEEEEEQEESNEKENYDSDSNIIQNPKTYSEEQEEIRMKFIDAAKQTKTESMGIEGGNVDTFDLIFSKKEKTDDDLKNEEETYKKFLHNTEKQMKKKQKIKFSPTDIMKEPITEGDKLLFQYTLGRKWVNKKNARSNKQQDYASNIEQGQSEYNEEEESEQDDLSIDEEDLDLQDAFELKHNFRFEDPNATVIPSFPRGSQEGSLRRHESKRRRERESKRNRESEIQKQHNEENKRLRALIRDETQRKLSEISKLAGVGLDKNKLNSKAKAILDDDDEFDEEKFDKMMSDMFNDEYYDGQEDAEEDENEIQAISREALEEEEELDINIGDKQNDAQSQMKKSKRKRSDEKELQLKDQQNETEQEDYQIDTNNSQQRKRRRTNNDEQENISQTVGETNQLNQTRSDLKDFLKQNKGKLDYEDILAGSIKTRFKYRHVKPNDYRMDLLTILDENDEELNRRMPLKFVAAPYRETDEPPKNWRPERRWVDKTQKTYQAGIKLGNEHQNKIIKQEEEQENNDDDESSINISKKRKNKKNKNKRRKEKERSNKKS